MAYVLDGLIEAIDYNTFSDDTDFTYGIGNGDSGYGQSAFPLVNVPVGKLVEAQEWEDLVNVISICAVHQGTVTTPNPFTGLLPEVAAGEIVEAHESNAPTSDPVDLNSTIALIQTNRLNFAPGSVTLFSNQLISTRVAAWANSIQHRFTTIWPNADETRYFFNSGGQVRIRGSRSGGSATPQNTAWTTLLSSMATVALGAHNTTTTGSTPDIIASSVGYYELTTVFQTIYSIDGSPPGGAYGANNIIIEARTMDPTPVGANSDNGRRLEFRVTYNDAHASIYSDSVTGTITSNVDIQRATAPLVGITSPVLATVIELTSGS